MQLCIHPPAPAGEQGKVSQTFNEKERKKGGCGSGGEEPKMFPRWPGNKVSLPHA